MADTAPVATVPLCTQEIPTSESRPSSEQQCGTTATSTNEDELLSTKHVELVTKTWKMVEDVGDLQGVGFILFRKIFEIAPAAIDLFPQFRDIPENERESDEGYSHHALQVVEAVQLAVQSLDDIPALIMILKDLGSVHCLHGIQDPHFDVVGQALLWTLGQGLGDAFTPEVKEAWTMFYNMVAEHMKEGLHEALEVQNE